MKALTPRQEAFARNVAAGMSQSDAYRQAYPRSMEWTQPSVAAAGAKMMNLAHVSIRVKELQASIAESVQLEASEILRETRRLAMSDIAGIVHTEGPLAGKIKLPHELDPATRAAVSSFEMDEFGRIKYKFWDKNSALDKALRVLGLFEKDNKQKTDPLAELAKAVMGEVVGPVDGVPPDEGVMGVGGSEDSGEDDE